MGLHCASQSIIRTYSTVSNYRSLDFFDPKFKHLSYSKICVKSNFFCCGLLYQYKFSINDLNLAIFAQIFLNKMSGYEDKKVK